MEAGAASSGGRGCRESGGDCEPLKKDKVERERKEKNRKKMEKKEKRVLWSFHIFFIF